MRRVQIIVGFCFMLWFCAGCAGSMEKRDMERTLLPFVDSKTPDNARPFEKNSNTRLSSYELVFSDEFEDNSLDTNKWNVQDEFYRKRKVIDVYADGKQIVERDGHLNIYYYKDSTKGNAYFAGRIDSRGKYAPTYGFFEARKHFVKPNGHQTDFWMMPEGKGMSVPDGVDSTANDGAEIDIIEGNKVKTYSCGLHWDGYGKAHQTNGQEIHAPNFHDTEYHVIGFEWDEKHLRWYRDGEVIRELTDPDLIPRVPHFLYFSGSLWGESDWPDGSILTNEFIQNGGVDKAYIDYIRVYQKKTN